MRTCPACRQTVPDAAVGFCPHCGAALAPGAPSGTPWEQRTGGWVSALVETTTALYSGPTAFFKAMPVTGGLGGPMAYGLIVGSVALAVGLLYRALFQLLAGGAMLNLPGGDPRFRALMAMTQGWLWLVLGLLFGPLFVAVGLFVGAALLHVGLLVVGGAHRGFEATFRVVCYASAGSLLEFIPCCGSIGAVVARVIFLVVGLSEAHGISRGAAVVALLVPFVLICCCCGAGGMGLGFLTGLAGRGLR